MDQVSSVGEDLDGWFPVPCLLCIYIYIHTLVGGLEHFLFFIIYGIILPIG